MADQIIFQTKEDALHGLPAVQFLRGLSLPCTPTTIKAMQPVMDRWAEMLVGKTVAELHASAESYASELADMVMTHLNPVLQEGGYYDDE